MVDVLVDDEPQESTEEATAEATEGTATAEPPVWKAAIRKWGVYALSLTAGIAVCLVVALNRGEPEPVAPEDEQGAPSVSLVEPPTFEDSEVPMMNDADRLEQGDSHFLAGNYIGAEKLYRQLMRNPSLPMDQLHYRQALCQEKLGKASEALDEYMKILELSHTSETTRHAARLGQARAWVIQRRFDSARLTLLGHLLAAEGDPFVLGSTLHQLARLTCDEVQPSNQDLLDDRMVFTDLRRRDEEYLLGLIDTSAQSPKPTIGPGIRVLDRFGNEPRDIQVRVGKRTTSVLEELTDLANVIGYELDLRVEFRDVLQARSVTIAIEESNLATVFDALLEPCGLIWAMDGNKLKLSGQSEVPADVVRTRRVEQSLRLCRDALSLFPTHPMAEQTFVCLGNLSFWEERYADAVSSYRELERRLDGSEQMSVVWFNQAKALLNMNQREGAREAFFHVVDVARGRAAESVAYIYLGRLFLDDGDVSAANRHLSRGLSRTQDDLGRQIGAITLATGYLLADNPAAANQTLMDHREKLRDNLYEDQAAFLSALARFRSTLQSTERLRRGHDLTAALSSVEPDRFFAATSNLLFGLAYGEIGFPVQKRNVFERAIERAPECEVRRKMIALVAADLVDRQDWSAAEEQFEELAENSSDEWRWVSTLGIANIAFAKGEDEKCLENCFELINVAQTTSEKSSVLKLMGRVYERRQEHHKAAICFAGMLPTVKSDANGGGASFGR